MPPASATRPPRSSREWLRAYGVTLALGTAVDRIEPGGDAATVVAGDAGSRPT